MFKPLSRVQMSVVGGLFGLATVVVVAVKVSLPSDADLAHLGSEAGLPTLAPAVLNQIDTLVRPLDSDHLEEVFDRYDYDLNDIREGDAVPRVYVTALPTDMPDLQSIDRRKALFLRTVLPLVLMANDEIEQTRSRLLMLKKRQDDGLMLSAADERWLARVYQRYGLEDEEGLKALLSHVDVVPPSLALAQAIEESGWGTSRFARKGNAIYGQRTWSDQVIGMVPNRREKSKSHRVRSYMNIMGGVRSYVHNLNTHPAYEDFRRKRAEGRAKGEPVDGWTLAGTLGRYSERGPDYIKQIRGLMKTNELRSLDQTSLVPGPYDVQTVTEARR